MIKRIILIAFLGVFLIGCKTKHKVTHGSRYDETAIKNTETETAKNTSQEKVKPWRNRSKKKKSKPEEKIEKKFFTMPEDTGKFVSTKFASPQEYIATFAEIALLEMSTYGIPASITLAQGLLESGNGKSKLARATNNHFGIKCHRGWKGEYDFFDDDEIGECFRKYNNPLYSYRDHSLFLYGRKRYAFLFDFEITDYKKWAYGLKKAGYATDKRYPQKLIRIVELYGLDRFDKGYDTRMILEKPYEPKVVKTAAQIEYDKKHPRASNYDKRDEFRVERNLKSHDFNEKDVKSPSTKKQRVNNEVKKAVNSYRNTIYVVKKGDTLYSISKKYSISVAELKRWNYIHGQNLSVGQKLTVSTKN